MCSDINFGISYIDLSKTEILLFIMKNRADELHKHKHKYKSWFWHKYTDDKYKTFQ